MQGLAKWYLKDYHGAITDYTVSIELNPKFSYAYNNRGLAESDLNNYAEAVADLDISLDLNPHNEFAYFNRGYAKYHLKDYKGAIADLKKQIEINPKDASAFAYLGYIQSDLFQFHPALNNFQKALQLDPSGAEYRFRIWLIRSRLDGLDDMLGASYDLNNYLRSLKEKKMTWTTAVGFFLVGSFSEENFLDCARSSDQKTRNWWQCRANYYAGIKHLCSGDKVGAMDFFQECLNTKETNFVEYISAEAEFNALKKIIPH
jgi:tetratricopeptide (TPR) repeat protein